MTQMQQRVLNNVVVANLDVHLWSGRKKLKPTDIEASRLPPAQLASLGSKRTISGEALRPGEMYKKRLERICETNGVRFLGGYAIPLAKAETVAKELNQVIGEASAWANNFLSNYDKEVEDWAKQFPEWEKAIREAITPVDVVRTRISFGYQMFQVTGVGNSTTDTNSGLEQAAGGLASQLFNEIAKEAQAVWENSMVGRTEANRRILRPLRAMQEKMDSLSFLDPRVAPVVDRIKQGIDSLPKTGPIAGNDLNIIGGLLFFLSDPDRMKKHGEAVLKGDVSPEAVAGQTELELPVAQESGAPTEAITAEVAVAEAASSQAAEEADAGVAKPQPVPVVEPAPQPEPHLPEPERKKVANGGWFF